MPSCADESAIFTRKHTSTNLSMFKPSCPMCCKHTCEVSHEPADNGIAVDFLSLSFAHGVDCITAMVLDLPQATSFVLDTQKRDDWLALYLNPSTRVDALDARAAKFDELVSRYRHPYPFEITPNGKGRARKLGT
jgi:hypothetical protein